MSTNRYIYAYRDKATGQALYVGSAHNVKLRDRAHCGAPDGTPIEREIASRGRAAFTIETLEEVDSQNSAARENFWMDSLCTFRTAHGFNFQRASQEFYKGTLGTRKRTIVYLPPDLEWWVMQEANRNDESVGAVIRRAVRKMMEPTFDKPKTEQTAKPMEYRAPCVLVADVPKVETAEQVSE